MKILFCGQTRLKKDLGGSKPLLELAEEMSALGWEYDTLSPFDFAEQADYDAARKAYPENLRRYLLAHAADYDVVDYDHVYLPYPRTEFPAGTLFVARSVLLLHHLQTIRVPHGRGLRAGLGALLKRGERERDAFICQAQMTVEQADLVNVTNHDDRSELVRRGIPADRIVVLPFGISRERAGLFDALSSDPPDPPVVAFVGTFDYRKGAREFPRIVSAIADAVPQAGFRLLGTAGRFPTREAVLSHFPARLHSRIDVQPRFSPDDLPSLLSACSVGVFPSYVEGFPFGVLEMLAASLPVAAYRSPGAPMMLAEEMLVPRGDAAALSERAIRLLRDQTLLRQARVQAKRQAAPFTWDRIARDTSRLYLEHREEIRAR